MVIFVLPQIQQKGIRPKGKDVGEKGTTESTQTGRYPKLNWTERRLSYLLCNEGGGGGGGLWDKPSN